MKQKTLSRLLKLAIIVVGVCGLFVYAVILPSYGQSIVAQYPEFENRFLPWLIFLCLSGVPCYTVLILGWIITGNIANDESFTLKNANLFKWISWLALGDSIYFFAGNVFLLFANMSHPGVALMSLIVVFAGITIAVAAAVLSRLIERAACLQEQSDLTI